MRLTRVISCLLMILMLTLSAVTAQEGDYDGDGVPDNEDYCFSEPGTVELNGCTVETFPDFDQDRVADPVDSCPNEPGLTTNSGCVEGVIPDFDSDGLPDAQDACPREYGEGANGCPPDADGDLITDFADACPMQAGISVNLGCPEGVNPPDADADGVPDLYDGCLGEVGVMETGGCADTDGDGVVDQFDVCPDQAGETAFSGCIITTEITLPANLAAISAANAVSAAEVGRLIVGSSRITLGGNNVLAVRGDNQVYLYDLTQAALTPTILTDTGFPDYPIALSATGAYLAMLDFPDDFSTPPYVQIRDGFSGDLLFQLVPPPDNNGQAVGISGFAFSPTDPALLAIAPLTGNAETVGVNVPIYDVASNSLITQFTMPGGAVNIAFSRDGSRLALDTSETETMAVYLFDPSLQTQVGRIVTTSELHFAGTPLAFNGDGSRLAIGYPDGSVHLWDTPVGADPSERVAVDLFGENEIVSAVAYSGDVIAVAGGVPFSGGLRGDEVFSIVLLNAETGEALARWDAHETLIRDLVFNNDGTLLISGADTSVRFWGVGG